MLTYVYIGSVGPFENVYVNKTYASIGNFFVACNLPKHKDLLLFF